MIFGGEGISLSSEEMSIGPIGQENENIEDKRDEVPDLERYLLPGEKVINVEIISIKEPTEYPSSLQAILRLTDSEKTSEIGDHGPSVASRVSPENLEVEELRKYEVVFGRDSLRVATDLADYYPTLLRTTVIRLAELQGIRHDNVNEEEPGRIIHEARLPDDPMAKKITEAQGWGWPYYGSVDATPMFIIGVAKISQKEGLAFLDQRYTDRNGKEHTIFDAFNNSLEWLQNRLDRNEEGFLESKRLNPKGLENQVWKDSWDSYFHKDGTLANKESGVASIEVQALAYDALVDAADLHERLANTNESQRDLFEGKSEELRTLAEKLKDSVMKYFWVEEEQGGYFALGTDRDGQDNLRKLEVKTSNMGHLLNSRVLEGNDPDIVRRREAVIRTLFSSEMMNVSGIRTLSKNEVRFRPGAYHNGNVWLWDNYYIARGLERHGYYGLSFELKKRILNVVDKTKKFPEYTWGGDDTEPKLNNRIVDIWDEENQIQNRLEQPPQEIQAWTVSAILAAKRENDPLKSGKRIPKEATDAEKRKFERQLLGDL